MSECLVDDAAMGDRQAKDALFDALAEVSKALASGRRAEIVELLAQGERSVEGIAGEIDQSVANTSHHLRAMARAGLVRTRREGTRIIYALASDRVSELWAAMRDVAAAHVAGVSTLTDSYLGDRRGIDVIDRDDLVEHLSSDRLVLLDVRPTVEYIAGHIPGAKSVPVEDLDDVVRSLPKRSEVIAYCRGPFCVYADDAIRSLIGRGFRARRLADGFPEWRRAGLPVETGAGSDERATSVPRPGSIGGGSS